MKQIRTLAARGNFYKGALHSHTIRSDGAMKPEELITHYKNNGFSFIAITDHHIYWNDDSYNTSEFCVLGGSEVGFSWGKLGHKTPYENRYTGFHLNVYFDPDSEHADKRLPHDTEWFVSDFGGQFIPEDPEHSALYTVNFLNRGKDNEITIYDVVKDTIRYFKEKGNIVMVNHPDWSRHLPEDLRGIEESFAIEIYNHGAEIDEANGYSLIHYDEILRKGQRYWAIATDDLHAAFGPIGGWVVVKASDLNPTSIIRALKAGSFYSSTGPEIKDFYIEDGYMHALTSPVKEISFIAYEDRGVNHLAPTGAYLHSAKSKIRGNPEFVRLEITDIRGNRAWSNPLFLK